MKKIPLGLLILMCSSVAHAAFSTAVQQDQSGLDVFATNSDERAHTCRISYRYTTENSPNGQTVNTSATARPGLRDQVIHSTRGGWSQFSASNVQVNCD